MAKSLGLKLTALLGTVAMLAACSPPATETPAPQNSGATQAPADTSTGGTGTTSEGTGGGKTVTVWLQAKPDNMSPLMGGSYGNGSVFAATQDRFALVSSKGELVPRAAASWEVSDDVKTITLHLAEQKWSDGEEFNADDVVFTANATADPAVASPEASQWRGIVGFEELQDGKAKELAGVSKVDDRTVKIELTEPDSGALYRVLTQWVLPEHTFADTPRGEMATSPLWAEPGGVPGLGPLVMTANVTGQRVEFEKNPNFRTPVKFDRMVSVLVSQDVATQQLSSGEMDVTIVGPPDVEAARGFQNVTLIEGESSGYDRYAFNMRNQDKFKDARVRQAFLYAVDRAGLEKAVYAGQSRIWNSSFTSPRINYEELEKYEYNPDKARELLKDAGWDANTPVEIVQASGNEQRAQINQVVMKNLQDVGVKASIRPIDPAEIAQMYEDGKFDLFIYGGGNYLADPSTNEFMLSCEGTANNGRFCDPEIDKLFAQARATADQDEQQKIYQELAKLDNAAASHLWMGRPLRVFGTSKRVTGVVAAEGMPDMLAESLHLWEVND